MVNRTNTSENDEVDLGQLFQLISGGFNSIFRFLLRVFLYLKKNIFILIGLIILGILVGFGIGQIVAKKLKTEVIVKPQFQSKNYLYNVINEVQANIEAEDTLFFNSIGIRDIDFKGLEVTVNRVLEEETSETDSKYLELLKSFENIDAIADILRSELQNKSSFNHRITFYYKDLDFGRDFSVKVMEYLNSNDYFEDMRAIYLENATDRIERNNQLIEQVDDIIVSYSTKMAQQDKVSGNDRIVLDNQETVNITGLFNLKNELIRNIEVKKLELLQNSESIKIINFGKSQEVQKAFFAKNLVLFPFIFVGGFFLTSFVVYLNQKAQEF